MAEPTADQWGAQETATYINYADIFVPRRNEQFDTVKELVLASCPTQILELGCGDGVLAERLLLVREDLQITLLDGSARMLGAARQRLHARYPHVAYLEATIESDNWAPKVPMDCIYSSLAIHHLDGESKLALYRKVYKYLRPGGMFVMCDLLETTVPATQGVVAAGWDCATRKAAMTRDGTLAAYKVFLDEQWNYYSLAGPDPIDHPSTLTDHVTWLGSAGFRQVDVCWAYGGHTILCAGKDT